MLAEEGLDDIEQTQREHKEWTQELKREVSALAVSVEEGDIVDVMDSTKSWRAAKVLAKEEKNIMVEFVGWEPKWNEPVALNSGKIKPFRSEAQTDTSSSKGSYGNKVKTLLLEIRQVPLSHPDP
jgi:hypothetical protein